MCKKILVVEDNRDTATVMTLMLGKAGYSVDVAFDGEQGLQRVREGHPDVILLDIMMPVMDGYTMNQRLKQDPSTREIPVIVVSARSGMGPLFEADSGARVEAYLVKPVTAAALRAKIADVLALRRQ
jgi:CheY-like chemotaxis protein